MLETLGVASARPKKYVCDFVNCDRAYSKPSLLEQHRRSHSDERPFRCTIAGCGKAFLRNSHLKAHALSHETQEEKPFHCSVCGKGVNTRQHLRRHELTHTKSFVCPYEVCGEQFYKHQSLRHHILSVHEKTLTCEVCKKSFSRPYRLAQHKLKYHLDSPAYQCDHEGCFRNFNTWSALQQHIKTEHPKLKCPVCGKGCVGQKGLKSHLIVHDETKMSKLWRCVLCQDGHFTKKADLIVHYKSSHDGYIPGSLSLAGEIDFDSPDVHEYQNEAHEGACVEVKNTLEYVSSGNSNNVTKSLKSLDSALDTSKVSIFDVIESNFSNLKCPKVTCKRRFRRQYDLQRHLVWHENQLNNIEAFVEQHTIREKEGSGINGTRTELAYLQEDKNGNDGDNDMELDGLIDTELKSLRAGEIKL